WRAEAELGDFARSAALLAEAANDAAGAGDLRLAADAHIARLWLVGARQNKLAEARAMYPTVDAVATLAGDPLRRGSFLYVRGSIEGEAGVFEPARRDLEAAIALETEAGA